MNSGGQFSTGQGADLVVVMAVKIVKIKRQNQLGYVAFAGYSALGLLSVERATVSISAWRSTSRLTLSLAHSELIINLLYVRNAAYQETLVCVSKSRCSALHILDTWPSEIYSPSRR